MGAPAYTCFCENGHMVKKVEAHQLSYEVIKTCPYCTAEDFVTIFDWGDGWDRACVPEEHCSEEWVDVSTDWFIGRQKVLIYDVSRVPKSKWRSETL